MAVAMLHVFLMGFVSRKNASCMFGFIALTICPCIILWTLSERFNLGTMLKTVDSDKCSSCSELLDVLKETRGYFSQPDIKDTVQRERRQNELKRKIEAAISRYDQNGNQATTATRRTVRKSIIPGSRNARNYTVKDVTILLDFTSNNTLPIIKDSIEQLQKNFTEVKTIIALSRTQWDALNITNTSHIKFVKRSTPIAKPGSLWNDLVSMAMTPLVLIGRGVIYIDSDIELGRAVREMLPLNVSVIGGAFRYTNGHWYMACQQSTLRNYTLIYTSGYHSSHSSCVFCKHVDGPFLIKRETARENKFDPNLGEDTIFHDFFLRLNLKGKRLAVCPDGMYHVKDRLNIHNANTWLTMAAKWQLDSIRMDSIKIRIPCYQSKYSCKGISHAGKALHPCCLRDLANHVKFLVRTSEENGLVSALFAGTLLGAIKYRGVIPWELDADTPFHFNTSNYIKAKSMRSLFEKGGYKFVETSSKDVKSFNIFKNGWKIDWYGTLQIRDQGYQDRNPRYEKLGFKPTEVNFDGAWLRTVGNPGNRMHVLYKSEIYKHSQHNSDYGLSFAAEYKPRHWAKCISAALGSHNCLKQYETDGNIQFVDDLLH